MDTRFDANAANRLLDQMNNYCFGIIQETRDLMEIMNNTPEWNDNQRKAFQNNVVELTKDLKTGLTLESEYMRTFHQRVNELREA